MMNHHGEQVWFYMSNTQQRPMLQVESLLHLFNDLVQLLPACFDALEKPVLLLNYIPLAPAALSLAVAQPQCIVMLHQLLPRKFQPLAIQFLTGLKQYCLVVVVRLGKFLLEEPPLDRSERHFALYCMLVPAVRRTVL